MIAWLELDILREVAFEEEFGEVDGEFFAVADDEGAAEVGDFDGILFDEAGGDAAGASGGLEEGHGSVEGVGSAVGDGAEDEVFFAAEGGWGDDDLGVGDVVAEC